MKTSATKPLLLGCLGLALGAASAHGALTMAFTTQGVSGNPHVGTITATTGDLLETQGSVAAAKDFNNTSNVSRATSLKDGSIATGLLTTSVGTDVFKGGTDDFVTFDLNTTINVLGYDITSLKTIAYWNNARAGQSWTVQYSVVGSASFTNFYTLTDQAASNVVSQVLLNDGGSVLSFGANSLTGVDAIRFNFDDISDWHGYREIDVIGAATIPEPSAALLGGLGMLALLRRRRA